MSCRQQFVIPLPRSFIVLSCLAVLLSGCSSIIDAHKQKEPYMSLYYSGKVDEALAGLEKKSRARRNTGDEVAWRLDEGTMLFTAGKYRDSLKAFRRAEWLIRDFDRRAVVNAREIGANSGMAVTNLNALPYRGFCVDRIMLNAYKALDYFALHDSAGALVELRRMRERQRDIVRTFQSQIEEEKRAIAAAAERNRRHGRQLGGGGDSSISFEKLLHNREISQAYREAKAKSRPRYGNFVNPFATYLSAIGYLLEQDYGEALVDFRNLYRIDNRNPLFQRDFVTCSRRIGARLPAALRNTKAFDYPLHKQIVFVLFFNGRGAALREVKFQIVLPFVGYPGFAFPRYHYYPAQFDSMELSYRRDGRWQSCRTVTIADFDAILSQEYRERLPTMITRLVISGLTKELGSAVAVYAARSGGPWAVFAAVLATGFYKYLFNTADTRCWETLPKEVQAVHFPRPSDNRISFELIPRSGQSVGGGDNSAKSGDNQSGVRGASGNGKRRKKFQIVLQNSAKVTIIYVRSLNSDKVIYKVFEL